MKKCFDCLKYKDLHDFQNRSDRKDGHDFVCKLCRQIRATKYRNANKEMWAKIGAQARKKTFESWRGFLPEKTNCECCGKEIFFGCGDISKTICFDHRREGQEIIKCNPNRWIHTRPCNEKNQKIWESCDFGMLCRQCNTRLPTKNRREFIENVIQYLGINVLYARKGAESPSAAV